MAEPKSRIIDAFVVFDPDGKLMTARLKRSDAEEAAAIIGGAAWEASRYTVEPVQIIRSQGRR